MSAVSTIYRTTCVFCEKVANFFKSLIKSIQEGRQMQANYYVAQQIYRSGEYKGESFDHILLMVNKGTLPARKTNV